MNKLGGKLCSGCAQAGKAGLVLQQPPQCLVVVFYTLVNPRFLHESSPVLCFLSYGWLHTRLQILVPYPDIPMS